MIIQRIFSKKEKDKKPKEGEKGAALVAGSIAVGKGGSMIGKKINEESGDYLINSELTAKDKEVVKEKLKEKAKKQGIKVIDDPNFENSAYTGSKIGKKLRNAVSKVTKAARKYGDENTKKQYKEGLDSIQKGMEYKTGSKHLWNSLGKDRILLGEGSLADTDVLSHELGHAQYERSGRSKSIAGKVAHKLMPVSKVATSKAGKGAIFAHGFQAGTKKEKNKREGKKTGAWDKVRSVAVPAALIAPVLVGEGKASLNGLKTMKKMGASKELMNQSKKRLGAAYGTYAGDASRALFMGGSGELAGRGVSKIMHSDDVEK